MDITLVFRNTDGSTSAVYVPFDRSPHPWTYTERLAVAPKRFSSVDAYVTFYDETGSAVFDAIRFWSL